MRKYLVILCLGLAGGAVVGANAQSLLICSALGMMIGNVSAVVSQGMKLKE